MAAKKGGLGKGLDMLFVDNAVEEIRPSSAVKLKIMDIEPNRNQPRKDFDEETLRELTDSIATYGVLQPLLVRPIGDSGYQLIAGERRWRAARLAGLTEVPVVVREMTDEEAAALALIENLQRDDLNPVEEAFGFRKLMDDFNLTQEQAAERVGKSRPAVANALRLLKLPPEILEHVRDNSISAGHARALLAFPTEEAMLETAQLILDKGISVRETERLAKKANKGTTSTAIETEKVPSYYQQVELTLREALGRKIKISNLKNDTGTLEISFGSREDLERVANALQTLEA